MANETTRCPICGGRGLLFVRKAGDDWACEACVGTGVLLPSDLRKRLYSLRIQAAYDTRRVNAIAERLGYEERFDERDHRDYRTAERLTWELQNGK